MKSSFRPGTYTIVPDSDAPIMTRGRRQRRHRRRQRHDDAGLRISIPAFDSARSVVFVRPPWPSVPAAFFIR